jgi:Domain of unknown function (DUF4062)
MVLKVFVSSTFRDLEAHRSKVIAGLRNLPDVLVLAMEDWTASPGQPKDVCLARVREAHVFVAIIGHLHGFVPDGDAHSITQSEYEEAIAYKKSVLAFVAPDDFAVSPKLIRADPHLDKQDLLRARILKAHVCDLKWSTADELATRVVAAVSEQMRRREPELPQRPPPAAPSIDLDVYRKRCRNRWAAVDLTAVAAPGALDEDTQRPLLSKIFIPQDCRRSRPPVSLPHDYLKEQAWIRRRRNSSSRSSARSGSASSACRR